MLNNMDTLPIFLWNKREKFQKHIFDHSKFISDKHILIHRRIITEIDIYSKNMYTSLYL